MADLVGLLDAQLSLGVADFSPDFGELVVPGFSRTESLSELAELLSGTSDKRSRAYKSARRQAERWSPSKAARARGVKARTPNLTSRQRLRASRRQQSDRLRRFRAHGGEMRILVSWYSSRDPEWLPPHHWQHITTRVMRTVIRLWPQDAEEAADELFHEFLRAYRVPNPEDFLIDCEVLDLQLQPTGG